MLSPIGTAGTKEDQGNIHQPSDPSDSISHQVIGSTGRGDIRSSNAPTATDVNTSQGNISPPENPFSYAIQAADQLLADLSAMNLTTVRSPSVSSTSTATTVTISRSNISPPPNPFSYAIQAADQLLVDLTSIGLISYAIQAAEQLIADLSAMNLTTVRSHSVTSTNTAPTATTS